MQITFIRHGQYNSSSGALTDEGIETMSRAALVLEDMYKNPKYAPKIPPWHDPDYNFNEEPSLGEMFQIATGVWGEKFLQMKLHADQLPDAIISSQMLRAIDSAEVLKEQLRALGGNPKLQTGVAYFNERTSGASLEQVLDFLKRLGDKGYKHIAIVTHQPTIQAFGYAFGADALPPPSAGSIVTFDIGDPANLVPGNHFPYGRTGVCDWTDDLSHEDVDKQIKAAISKKQVSLLDVPTLRKILDGNKRNNNHFKGPGSNTL